MRLEPSGSEPPKTKRAYIQRILNTPTEQIPCIAGFSNTNNKRIDRGIVSMLRSIYGEGLLFRNLHILQFAIRSLSLQPGQCSQDHDRCPWNPVFYLNVQSVPQHNHMLMPRCQVDGVLFLYLRHLLYQHLMTDESLTSL